MKFMTTYLSGQELEDAFEATGISRLSIHGYLYETVDSEVFCDALNVLVDNGYTLADSSIEQSESRIYSMRLRSPGTGYPMSFTLRLPVAPGSRYDVLVWRDFETRQVHPTDVFSFGDLSPEEAKACAEQWNVEKCPRKHFWIPGLDGSRLIKS
jgi:hypothetical protein